jgi:hypothetical protein
MLVSTSRTLKYLDKLPLGPAFDPGATHGAANASPTFMLMCQRATLRLCPFSERPAQGIGIMRDLRFDAAARAAEDQQIARQLGIELRPYLCAVMGAEKFFEVPETIHQDFELSAVKSTHGHLVAGKIRHPSRKSSLSDRWYWRSA